MKSSEICAILRERYKQPEWALFFEVANGTGGYAKRHADALAMNMYPSRGLSIIGFEIKVSRGDLNRELANPDKAEAVAQYCDEWYLVVPKGLIREEDMVPVPWGVMECEASNLRITKKAERLDSKPVTREFVAAVLRSAGKVDEATLREERDKAYRDYKQSYAESLTREIERRTKRFEEMQKQIAEFESITGKRINAYTDVENLARNIQLAEQIDVLYQRYGGLRTIRQLMEEFLEKTGKIALPDQQQSIGKVGA